MLLSSSSISSHRMPANPLKKRGLSLLLSQSENFFKRDGLSTLHPFFSSIPLLFPYPSPPTILAISKFSSKSSPRKTRTLFNFPFLTSQHNRIRNICAPLEDSNSTNPSKILNLPFLSELAIVLSLILLFTDPLPALADPGAALFRRSCIGCHDAGGNVIQPGATLFAGDLDRNGVSSEEEIYQITYGGKGRMPGFGLECAPRGQCTFGPRLSDDEIRALAKFVKAQAEQGWVNSSSIEE